MSLFHSNLRMLRCIQLTLRSQRFAHISFMFSELRAREELVSRTTARFSREEWTTLGSLLQLMDLDLYLSYDGESEQVLVAGTAGDPNDPQVYGTFAGLLARELIQRVWVEGCDGVWLPGHRDPVEYSDGVFRSLSGLTSEESTALLLTLETERMMGNYPLRSDAGATPKILIPSQNQLHEIFN